MRAMAAKFHDGADVEASAALAANVRLRPEGAHHFAARTPESETDRSGHHLFGAHPHAFATLDAFFEFRLQALAADAIAAGEILNRLRLRTSSDVEFQQQLASALDPCRVRLDDQTLIRDQSAGALQFAAWRLADFHEAEPAGAVGSQAVVVAEGGDGNAEELRRLEHGGAAFDFDYDSIDRQFGQCALPVFFFCLLTPYSTRTAFGWHTSKHAPHFVHRALSMV